MEKCRGQNGIEKVLEKCHDDKKHQGIVVQPQVFNIKQVGKGFAQEKDQERDDDSTGPGQKYSYPDQFLCPSEIL